MEEDKISHLQEVKAIIRRFRLTPDKHTLTNLLDEYGIKALPETYSIMFKHLQKTINSIHKERVKTLTKYTHNSLSKLLDNGKVFRK